MYTIINVIIFVIVIRRRAGRQDAHEAILLRLGARGVGLRRSVKKAQEAKATWVRSLSVRRPGLQPLQ